MTTNTEEGKRAVGAEATKSTGFSKWRQRLRYLFAVVVPAQVTRQRLRYVFAIATPALVTLYVIGILDGRFAGERRLNSADTIVVIGTAAVLFAALRPELFDRLGKVKLGSLEFEVLHRLDERQQKQQTDLDDIRFVLTLLQPPSERSHLENLGKGETLNYRGNYNLKGELRNLRNLKLIENRRPIADIPDGAQFDLKDFVRLTEAGHRYLIRLAHNE